MRKTRFAGLTALEPGESIFVDGSSFTARNPDIIDHFLESGARTHHHDAAPPLANPTTAPQVTVYPTGGALPGDTTILVAYTRLDGEGGETEASPVTAAVTEPGITAPLNPPVTEIDYGIGTLTVGTYHYAVTLVDLSGGETTASPIASVVREPGNPNATITISDLAALVEDTPGAVRYRLYRAKDLGKLLLLSEGVQDVIEDDGSLECDCCTTPPATNQSTTGQTSALGVVVTAGMLGDAVGWRLYVTADGSFISPSLYGTDRTLAEADQTITIMSLDVDEGAPPDISTSIGGAPKINPDTDLLNWHWKQPVASPSELPVDSNTQAGDVRVALSDGTIYRFVDGSWAPFTAPAAHFMPPVANFAALPSVGNAEGDLRMTLDDFSLYAWSAADGTWHDAAAGTAGGGGGGHEIYDEATALMQRAGLAFVGAGVTVTDDNANDRTVVTIPGGGGGPGGVTFPLDLGQFVSWRDAAGTELAKFTLEQYLYNSPLYDFDFTTEPDADPRPDWFVDGPPGVGGDSRVDAGKLYPRPHPDDVDFWVRYTWGGNWRDLNAYYSVVLDTADWRRIGVSTYLSNGNFWGVRIFLTSAGQIVSELKTDPDAGAWNVLGSTPAVNTPSVGDEISLYLYRYDDQISYGFYNITADQLIADGDLVVPAGLATLEGFPALFAHQITADSFHLLSASATRVNTGYQFVSYLGNDRYVMHDTTGLERWNGQLQITLAPDWQEAGIETRKDLSTGEVSFRGQFSKLTGAAPVAGELIATLNHPQLAIRAGDVPVVTGDSDGRQLGIATFVAADDGTELRWGDGRSSDPATKAPWLSLEGVRR